MTRSLNIATKIWLFKAILLINLFFPTFNAIIDDSGRLGFRIHSLILLCISIAYILLVKNKYWNKSLLLFATFSIIILLNIAINGFLSYKTSVSDALELYRPVSVFIFILAGYFCYANSTENDIEELIRFLSRVLLGMAIIWVAFYFFKNSLISNIWGMYSKQTLVSSRRISGTFVNPYDFSYVLVLPFIYYYLQLKSRNFLIALLNLAILSIAILISQSKIGIAMLLLAVFWVPIFSVFLEGKMTLKDKAKIFSVPIIIITGGALIVINFYDQFEYVFAGFLNMIEGSDSSTNIRLNQISIAIDIWTTNFKTLMFGVGSLKSELSNFENIYFLYLVRMGMLGFTIVLLYMIFIPALGLLKSLSAKSSIWFVLCSWLLFSIPVGFANNTIDQMRVSFIFYSFVGILITFLRSKKPEYES